MRSRGGVRHWWAAAFVVLFLAYQLPQVLVRLGVPASIAGPVMLALYPLAAVLAWRGGQGFGRAYGLEWHGRWWPWLLALFALALIAKAFAIALGVRAGIYASHGPIAQSPTAVAWAAMALVTFLPSLAEDMLTRGLWRHSPLARSGAVFVVGTAAVYTLNHAWRLALGPAEWAMLFCFGVAYGVAFWRTGSLWAAVGLHWGWNFAGQAVDAVWQVDVLEAVPSKLLSAAVHLVLAGLVLAMTAGRTSRARPLRAQPPAASSSRPPPPAPAPAR